MLKDSSMNIDRKSVVASAVRTLETERAGLKELAEALDNGLADPFAEAVRIIAGIKGRLIVTGVGKSGHIGSKIAATLASTGTPAFFVHPAEANHGDLGMIGDDDVILAMSWSGETTELHGIVAYARRFAIPIIAITAGKSSALAREATVVLGLPRAPEACPHGLAPTTSTVLQLVIGDALAVALLEARGFTADHFRTFHPGGQLGAKLTQVRQIMHSGSELPLASSGALMREAILEMTQKGFGCVGITDADGVLIGIITDGDLRRHIDSELLSMTVDQVMTRNPKTIGPETLAESALQVVNSSAITTLMVVEDGKPCGVVHLHDLLRIGAA
ncbi:KpsF/GutQ family sugar-phosphate isomerase [Nitratireductor sp. L1-7-SE]|uniref:Arabinose-5-phosphate isomerase n=3 Tax=Nitratireductor TaxID=245876 RepID=A0A1H4JJ81_9HYPH|nr:MULTISPECIES: KpsF/GutQ family sugar-phosphate isomerase [Nitratireductor]MBY8917725.1 KpsF/GutQ family sugar-phosphate isomerase [Nitratireductor rhodophyticola]MEC9247244.1 KpsF/GutQ family sugar-phosphate isomerase [Pseudomonadota bacterium]EIM74629.1 KpsF/GutQ family protein [Nitratireductor aquibiodomus RA22]MBY8922436.1 KpsF/GutQ family sugar-phosphate isomerase [Nitratireductor rhodophyticola]SEB46313.1 arabinose-5-phosphate isomerase [Nitratireductor aquibiodomus]